VKVMIGVDPHKRSHTSVAIDDREQDSARIHVPGQRRQVRSCDAGRRRGCECWARPVEQERPNDSRSVAVAALRAPDLAAVQPAHHVAVLWACWRNGTSTSVGNGTRSRACSTP
jgi:hypothetical protein